MRSAYAGASGSRPGSVTANVFPSCTQARFPVCPNRVMLAPTGAVRPCKPDLRPRRRAKQERVQGLVPPCEAYVYAIIRRTLSFDRGRVLKIASPLTFSQASSARRRLS